MQNSAVQAVLAHLKQSIILGWSNRILVLGMNGASSSWSIQESEIQQHKCYEVRQNNVEKHILEKIRCKNKKTKKHLNVGKDILLKFIVGQVVNIKCQRNRSE